MTTNASQIKKAEINETENGVKEAKKADKDALDLTDEELRNVTGGIATTVPGQGPKCSL